MSDKIKVRGVEREIAEFVKPADFEAALDAAKETYCNFHPGEYACFEAGARWALHSEPVAALANSVEPMLTFIECLYADGPESFDKKAYMQVTGDARAALARFRGGERDGR